MEDHQSTPFPGKIQSMKSNIQRKYCKSSMNMMNSKDSQLIIHGRQKRVFGTVRNSNIPAGNTASEKPKSKFTSSGIVRKPTKSTNDASSSERKITRKSVKFREITEEIKEKEHKSESDISISISDPPRTPAKSPSLINPRRSLLTTPYLTAEKCSKCRFDKLVTSSYWLAQIKLAESVGKHFVSANFFRMAFECRAEPIRNLKVELKKYVSRNENDLREDKDEWKDLFLSYGLMKNDHDDECRGRGDGEDECRDEQKDEEEIHGG